MSRRDHYRAELRALAVGAWAPFLREHSGLPGPRGNLELADAAADEGDLELFDQLIATDEEYLVFCGVVGLGQVLAVGPRPGPAAGAERAVTPDDRAAEPDRAGRPDQAARPDQAGRPDLAAADDLVRRLRAHAADPRWRVREATATALQRLGDADPSRLSTVVADWARDPDPLVQRAAIAGICEPRLLVGPVATAAVDLCALVTDSLAARPRSQRPEPQVRTLRQALGYCWSVAVAADPGYGLPRFLSLDDRDDRDVAWIVRENRRKKRLAKLL